LKFETVKPCFLKVTCVRWYPDNAGDLAATAAGGQVRPLHQARGGAEGLLDTGAGHMPVLCLKILRSMAETSLL
jgi:hypothetical protein